ncbi:LO6 protein [Japanese eel endothelial cells-infecting virus]|uniref:LO6 protein n=1 Tax=Japanese eel endothelial cells-infecting virus TaxID=712037 RepID=UPI00052E4E57|nr:LO6 protein [Japanese eel endothelial cells-infecting virus]
MELRGTGVGPWARRGGFTDRRRSYTRSYARGGGPIRNFLSKQWNRFKTQFLPLARRHAGTLAKMAVAHALEKKDDYMNVMAEKGVKGVTGAFVQHLPGLAAEFIRKVASPERGAGDVPAEVHTMMSECRDQIEQCLCALPYSDRPVGLQAAIRALEHPDRGAGDSVHDSMAPLQNMHDIVLSVVGNSVPSAQRGGILPFLIPLLASGVGAAVSSIPKIIELATAKRRGGGDVLARYAQEASDGRGGIDLMRLYRPALVSGCQINGVAARRRGGGGGSIVTDEIGGPVTLTRQKTSENQCKVIIKKCDGVRGRPQQRTFYIPKNTLF